MFADGAFDLVFAVDAFPYVVAAGPALADAMLAEMRRTARPGGDVLVINWSYRGDLARDRADARAMAARHGLELLEAGAQPFAHWDGAVFRMRRPAHAPAASAGAAVAAAPADDRDPPDARSRRTAPLQSPA
jgi:SAM-dependent methyltransferase